MGLSSRAKKKLAVVVVLVVIVVLATQPGFHSNTIIISGNGTLNSTDYYSQYYGNATGDFKESWVEFSNPMDLMGYYYCNNSTALQVGVFVVYGNATCYGFVSPLELHAELDPYGTEYYACYGARLADKTGCVYD